MKFDPKVIAQLPRHEQEEILRELDALAKAKKRRKRQSNFLEFVKSVWPEFIHGTHHEIMADAFERVANGKLKRLIINMPPRHTKSEFASYLLPAWYLGRYPSKKIIQATHTADLATGFGRKVRNLINDPIFQETFPGVSLTADNKAAGRWQTNKRGEYYAVGVGGALAGRGADLAIIDDPHSEQDAITAESDPSVYDSAWNWFSTGPRQRLQPNGAIIMVMTRWAKNDMTGRAIDHAMKNEGASQWEVIELPAILPSGKGLWTNYWSQEEYESFKADLPVSRWQAQYQQQPTSEEGAIIKREWWRRWTKVAPPKCEAVMVSWDTAFLKTERADYSACTTWGIFYVDDEKGRKVPNVILLDAFKDKYEFPELKAACLKHYREKEPDILIVEAKAAGSPLIAELRRAGIPVSEYTPTRGNDKIARANAVSDLFASGSVWAPETNWAQEVIEECAEFPYGSHDDYVDTTTQALLRFRQGGWVSVSSDEEEEEFEPVTADYY